MNPPSDPERLLGEILAEAEPAGFRDSLLHETLYLAKRHRRLRQLRQSALALGAAGLGVLLGWRFGSARAEPAVQWAFSYATVGTELLPASAIVRTQRLDRGRVVVSTAGVEVVRTTPVSSNFQKIGDEELLALANPRPAVLVRRGPHSAELILSNPDGQENFPVN